MTHSPSRFKSPVWILLPVLAAVLFHAPALFCGFVWDDVPVIENNTHLAKKGAIPRTFSGDYAEELGSDAAGYYRPLFLSLATLVYRAFGPSPLAFHAVSLVLFCGVVLLTTLVCRRLLGPGREALALVAGLVVAAHPARMEVVSLFTSLPDLLVEGFALIIVLLACNPARQSLALQVDPRQSVSPVEGETLSSRSPSRLAVSAGCLLAALAAGLVKESAFFIVAGLAGAALLVAVFHRDRRASCLAAALGCLAGLAFAVGARTLADIESQYPLHAYVFSLFRDASGHALQGLAWTIRDVVVPAHAVLMKEPSLSSAVWTQATLIAVFVAVAAILIIMARKGSVFGAFLLAWFAAGIVAIMLLITANIPYSQRYLPLLPGVILLCMFVDLMGRVLSQRMPASNRVVSRYLIYVVALYVTLHGAFTMAGSARCLTPTSFFSYMAERGPSLLYPRLAMVRLTSVHGFDPHLAERYLQEAEILSPRSPEVRKLGKLLARHHISEGLYDEAIGFLDWATEVIGEDAESFGLKAAALAYTGKLEDAARVCQQAIDLDPTNTTYQTLAAQIAADLQ